MGPNDQIVRLIFSAFLLEIGQQADEAKNGGANNQITTSLTRQLQSAKGGVSIPCDWFARLQKSRKMN